MQGTIKEVSGKVSFANGEEMKFNSLKDFFEILSSKSGSFPEFVSLYGLATSGKTYQVVLDYCMFGEQQIDIEKIRFRKFQRYLGDILVAKKLITPEILDPALKMQEQSLYKERIGELLVRLGYVTSDQIIDALTEQLGIK
ncbi:MAG: hypothetical protein ABII27_03955 [bacterium]